MELEPISDHYRFASNFDVFIKIRTSKEKSEDKICTVCLLDEKEEIDILTKWDRVELRCKHQMHTRCFNAWLYKKQTVSCPLCGDVDLDNDKNMNCIMCFKWGHSWMNCHDNDSDFDGMDIYTDDTMDMDSD